MLSLFLEAQSTD